MTAADPGRTVVLALGSNLGDRLANLQGGVDALCARARPADVAVSPVYETAPVGGPAQPDYLNAVLVAGHDAARPRGPGPRQGGRERAGPRPGAALGTPQARRRCHRLRDRGQRRSRAHAAAPAGTRAGLRARSVARCGPRRGDSGAGPGSRSARRRRHRRRPAVPRGQAARTRMTPTRPWTLLAVAAACAVVAWLVVRSSFADLPTLPWTGVPALVLLAAAEALSGRNLRAKIMGRRDGKPLAPMAVARMAALAKASSLGGAAFGGLAAGFFAYTRGLPRHDGAAGRCDQRRAHGRGGCASWSRPPCIWSAAAEPRHANHDDADMERHERDDEFTYSGRASGQAAGGRRRRRPGGDRARGRAQPRGS